MITNRGDEEGSAPIIIGVVLVVVVTVAAIFLVGRDGEPTVEVSPVTDPPPVGWDSSREPDCWEGTAVNPDTGRCVVADDPGAEYIPLGAEGPHAYEPFPQIVYIYVAVPDSASEVQVRRVIDSYVASQPGFNDIADVGQFEVDESTPPGPSRELPPLGMVLIVVYDYSDVVFGDYIRGRDFTGDPRLVHATGTGGVAYDYVYSGDRSLSPVIYESGRDGRDLPEDCIAIDLSFEILSRPTVDQLQAYYDADSPFQAYLDNYIELGGVYGLSFPEPARQKWLRGDARYDILIKLYQGDARAYYDSISEESSEPSRHPELPEIAINGCQ